MRIAKSIILCLALAIPALPQSQPTVTVTKLATFPFQRRVGRWDLGAMTQGAGGNFYGVTKASGRNDLGTVFLMTPQGGLKILFDFDGTHGVSPLGPLVQGRGGYLYGTTLRGGAHKQGTIFKISRSGVIQTIHSFSCTPANCTDGKYPNGGLVRGLDGWLYGTTSHGGVNHSGIVFRIGPNGTYDILSSTALPSGAALLVASDGNLYGVGQGGIYQRGSIYKVTPQRQVTTFYSFGALPTDSAFPLGSLIQGTDGDLYGINNFNGTFITAPCSKSASRGHTRRSTISLLEHIPGPYFRSRHRTAISGESSVADKESKAYMQSRPPDHSSKGLTFTTSPSSAFIPYRR
jgi:uncharacterized repeat protein (TIGR03803 family)